MRKIHCYMPKELKIWIRLHSIYSCSVSTKIWIQIIKSISTNQCSWWQSDSSSRETTLTGSQTEEVLPTISFRKSSNWILEESPSLKIGVFSHQGIIQISIKRITTAKTLMIFLRDFQRLRKNLILHNFFGEVKWTLPKSETWWKIKILP